MFGHEPTHFCIMSKDDDPRRVQCQLIQSRLEQLQEQMDAHTRILGDAELKHIKDENNSTLKNDFEQLNQHGGVMRDKKLFLESMMHRMAMRVETNNETSSSRWRRQC
jgi:hypothetical protein